ncbi:iron-siderophore ABC transporter substrate-binding protein [Nostoc sp. ChiQUE01b]|uniref:ABC transporter substrate-binding protein n=1 Tax=Nostoc sp. ChiQUE01b TaxID=3075376 RepID=UPI002AD3E9A8|nr:iron-siderophore ABC transporter substrate-binding protein [Nostoc sp. ChiQUE01b]MDZ8264278.1 iron-siderophore ABC transporter substrate-binding protein [Nostoc sp. ChiQUE01b]
MMTRRIHRLIKPFLLVALSVLLMITACHKPSTSKNNLSTAQAKATSECRVIKHRLGEACIPLKPKRIVTLDAQAILDSLLALGIKPVGTAVDHFGDGQDWSGKRFFPALLPELVEGIESVGAESTPSLEKILQLKPDLILLANQSELAYQQLSKIAPAVLIDTWKDKIPVPIKENFRHIAKIMGKEKEGEEVLAQYQERVAEFKNQLGDRLRGLEISVIYTYYHSFEILANSSHYYQVFQDLNLPIKPILLRQEYFTQISIEKISDFDADILFFIADINNTSPLLYQHPLIRSLKAFKNGKAYIADIRSWEFYGPIGMNLFLDDLAKYLLEGKQDPYFPRRG